MSKSANTPAPLGRLAKAPFANAVLVCGKCARKLPGGPKAVRAEIKAALKSRAWGKVRVVETRCFDLCPKRRQVLASARVLGERRLLVVEPGFDARAALHTLLGPPLAECSTSESGLAGSEASPARRADAETARSALVPA